MDGSGVEWMEGGREGGRNRGGQMSAGVERWQNGIGGQMDEGARRNERMSGGKAERKTEEGGGRHGGWREQWRNNEQAALL